MWSGVLFGSCLWPLFYGSSDSVHTMSSWSHRVVCSLLSPWVSQRELLCFDFFFQAVQWSLPLWVRYLNVFCFFILCMLYSFHLCSCLLVSTHLRDSFCGLYNMSWASKYILLLRPQTNRTPFRTIAEERWRWVTWLLRGTERLTWRTWAGLDPWEG